MSLGNKGNFRYNKGDGDLIFTRRLPVKFFTTYADFIYDECEFPVKSHGNSCITFSVVNKKRCKTYIRKRVVLSNVGWLNLRRKYPLSFTFHNGLNVI